METEAIDRLFLELSQFTAAITAKELKLQSRIHELEKFIRQLALRPNDDSMRNKLLQKSLEQDLENKCFEPEEKNGKPI